jgi:hypothetical protein
MRWLPKWFAKSPVLSSKSSGELPPDERKKAVSEIEQYVHRDVAGGFLPEEDIVQIVTDVLSDDFDQDAIKPLVIECTRQKLAAHLTGEKLWPELTDCDRLDRAFAELESRGVICRQDFSCCGTCGSGEIRDEMEKVRSSGSLVRGYAFYHMQDTEHAVEGHGIYLAYGATEDGSLAAVRIGHEICDALRAEKLTVEWDGDLGRRIFVKLDWKRRRGPRCSAR